MAELLKSQSKRKTRTSKASTSSETSSISSPEYKKINNTEESDEVMTALNMTDTITEKLNLILSKMELFESFSKSVQKIESSLEKMEERMSALESNNDQTTKEIVDLKESMEYLSHENDRLSNEAKDVGKDVKTLKSRKIVDLKESMEYLRHENDRLSNEAKDVGKDVKTLKSRSKELGERVKELEDEIEDLKTKDLYLEAYSRRENIIFRNIDEHPWENTEAKLREFLKDELKYENYDNVEFQRVHYRNPSKSTPRPIIARSLRYKDCEDMLALGKNLKGKNYSMFPDLPNEIVKRRKQLVPILKKAKENKIPASFSKAKPDKLFVRGKEWILGQELDMI
ncbi:LINE-1 retrotransposable element ORF1 protein [Exaiptasia diaphana]|nr:LINE-1 retrotransposable element ORF1 protein [Exaiptasia diaphana]